jgi:selenocysteine lyase/cysteine desulfurase
LNIFLDLAAIRSFFPAWHHPGIFHDNPGGTQIPQPAIDRMLDYRTETNANMPP